MSSTRGSRAFSNIQLESLRYQRSAIPAAGGVMAVTGDGGVDVTTNLSISTMSVTGHASLKTVTSEQEVTNSLRVLGGATITSLDTNNVIIKNGLTVTTLGVSGSATVGGTLTAPTIIVTDIAVTNLILPTTIAQPIGTTLICAPQILAGTTYNVPFLSRYALDVSGSAQISKGLTVTDLTVTNQVNLPVDISVDNLMVRDVFSKYIVAGSEIERVNPYALWTLGQAVFDEGVTVYGPMDLADKVAGTTAQMNTIIVGGTVQTQGLGVSGQANVGSLNVTTGMTAGHVYAPGATFGMLQILNGTILSGGLTVDTLSVTGLASMQSLAVGSTAQVQALGVTGDATIGSLVVGSTAQVQTLGVTGLGSLGSLVVGGTAQVQSLGVTGAATFGTVSVTAGLTAQGLSAAGGTINVFYSQNAKMDSVQIVKQLTFDPGAVIVIPTSYHNAVLANQMVAGTTNYDDLNLLYAMDVSGTMLVKGGVTVQGAIVGSRGVSTTTGSFSGNATIGGGLTVTGQLVASAGISGTTANFSGALTASTGNFSSSIASAGISGTTANFSGALTASTGNFSGGVTSSGIIRGTTIRSTTTVSAQGMNICTDITSGIPTAGLFIGQGSGSSPYTLPDSGGAILTWNTVKSVNGGATENGNFEIVVGSGAGSGNFRMYNTVGGASGTTAFQNTLALSRTGNLSLLGGITATTGFFNSGVTITGLLTANAGLAGTTANFTGNLVAGGLAGTTANFSNNVTIGGGLTVSGLLAIASLTATTANFTGNLVSGGLAGTTANFSNNVVIGGGLTVAGSLAIASLTATTLKATGFAVSNESISSPATGLFVGQATAPSGIYTMPTSNGAAFTWNAIGANLGNLELTIGSGNGGLGSFNIYNTTGTNGTTSNQNIFSLSRTGSLTLAGPLQTSYSPNTTIVSAPTYAWRLAINSQPQYGTGNAAIVVWSNNFQSVLSYGSSAEGYTVPIDGIYFVSCFIKTEDFINDIGVYFTKPTNANYIWGQPGAAGGDSRQWLPGANGTRCGTYSQLLDLKANDKITVGINSGATNIIQAGYFWGYLVCAL